MLIRQSVSISLSPELQAVAERLRATGRYGNIGDVMRTAPRLLEERELAFQDHRTGRLAAAAHRGSDDSRRGTSTPDAAPNA